MDISVDGELLFSLTETQEQVIKDNVPSSVFDADMKRRLEWVLTHKYDECFKDLMNRWVPILRDRVSSVPTDKDAFATLVFSQPDYTDAEARKQAFEASMANK